MFSLAKPVTFLVMTSALSTAGCARKSDERDPTRAWFAEKRAQFITVREMLVADRGAVATLNLSPLGALRSVTGARGHCGSNLRGGEFPWRCTDGTVLTDIANAEKHFGLPAGRLREYERMLPAKQVGPNRCGGATDLEFWLENPDGRPCEGIRNVVWSPSQPGPRDPTACPSTVITTFEALGDGFYAARCR